MKTDTNIQSVIGLGQKYLQNNKCSRVLEHKVNYNEKNNFVSERKVRFERTHLIQLSQIICLGKKRTK